MANEINELRYENRKLRYHLKQNSPRGFVNRLGAFIDSRANILPKIVGRKIEIQSGARERLSTPPCKVYINIRICKLIKL